MEDRREGAHLGEPQGVAEGGLLGNVEEGHQCAGHHHVLLARVQEGVGAEGAPVVLSDPAAGPLRA
eukprot:15469296-Alexandrium_andersonii.AAC.1